MIKLYIRSVLLILFWLLFLNIVILYYKKMQFLNYNEFISPIKKKLLFYNIMYNNCNIRNNPLLCGHRYEGYKKQKKGIHPSNILSNLSLYKSIEILTDRVCERKDIIIGVVCAPHHFMERMSIRMGYKKYKNELLLFFTGLSSEEIDNKRLYEENDIYNDIVIFDFISYYFNSSLLMVLEINWVNSKCKEFKYLVYHTPDVFLNYFLFYKKYIIETKIIHHVIAQKLIRNRVLRSNKSRFYVPFAVYNSSYYPPQPNGPLIIFSKNILNLLISRVDNVKLSFWMDDVFLSFLLYETKINIYNLNNIISSYPVQVKVLPNVSHIITKVIYIHSLPPGAIFFLLNSCNNYYLNKNT